MKWENENVLPRSFLKVVGSQEFYLVTFHFAGESQKIDTYLTILNIWNKLLVSLLYIIILRESMNHSNELRRSKTNGHIAPGQDYVLSRYWSANNFKIHSLTRIISLIIEALRNVM